MSVAEERNDRVRRALSMGLRFRRQDVEEMLYDVTGLGGIVAALSRCHAPWQWSLIEEGQVRCVLCERTTGSEDLAITRETAWHAETCPWRRAREATS